MAARYNFVPSDNAAFQFEPTLDGDVHTAIVTWNYFGQRFYINIFDVNNVRVLSEAVVGSPIGLNIQALSWRNGRVSAALASRHPYLIGQTIELTLSGCAPSGYNGKVEALIDGPASFSYPLATNPGIATAVGVADFNVDLIAGYFKTSTLVFRSPTQQFEVSPG